MNTPLPVQHKYNRLFILGFFSILLLVLVSASVTLYYLSHINDQVKQIVTVNSRKTEALGEMRDAMRERQVTLRDMMIHTDPFNIDADWQRHNRAAEKFLIAREQLEALGFTPEERIEFDILREKVTQGGVIQVKITELLLHESNGESILQLFEQASTAQMNAFSQMDKLFALQRRTATEALANTRTSHQFITNLTFISGLFIVVLGSFIAATVIRQNNQQLNLIRQYQDHLEEQVSIRTRELETMNKELRSYSHSLAHDLRTPVRAIMSFSQILYDDLKDVLTKEQVYDFNRIINASDRMHTLIDDILNLAKITRSELQLTDVDITELATQITHDLNAAYPDHQVACEIEEGLVTEGDTTLIRILLDNLLSNAWKFTQKSEVPQIKVGKQIQGPNTIFYVSDNGIGIEPVYKEKIFQPFQRLHRHDEIPGSGVGLAIVDRVIQRHHGHIWVESTPQKGATFYFTLG
jgi:signal transduction histidine kinase